MTISPVLPHTAAATAVRALFCDVPAPFSIQDKREMRWSHRIRYPIKFGYPLLTTPSPRL